MINFYKDERIYDRVDIIIDSPVDCKEAAKDALKIRVENLATSVISPEKFIRMKKILADRKTGWI